MKRTIHFALAMAVALMIVVGTLVGCNAPQTLEGSTWKATDISWEVNGTEYGPLPELSFAFEAGGKVIITTNGTPETANYTYQNGKGGIHQGATTIDFSIDGDRMTMSNGDYIVISDKVS